MGQTDRQTDGQDAMLNAAGREGHIIMVLYGWDGFV